MPVFIYAKMHVNQAFICVTLSELPKCGCNGRIFVLRLLNGKPRTGGLLLSLTHWLRGEELPKSSNVTGN